MMKWLDDVSSIGGTGQKKKADLQKLGIHTVYDFVTHYPRSYIDQSAVTSMMSLRAGDMATVSGVIMNITERRGARGTDILTATLSDGSGYLSLTWFNQPFLKKKLTAGKKILATGRVDHSYGGYGALTMRSVMSFEVMGTSEKIKLGVLPVYPLSGSLTQNFFRKAMRSLLSSLPPLPEVIPDSIRESFGLMGRMEAVERVHFPKDMAETRRARDRLAFEELFLIQCGLLLMKRDAQEAERSVRHLMNGSLVRGVIDSLPYRLTEDQEKVFREVSSDMEKPAPMRRLVQGDVGSGKTAIALLALVKTVENGYQGALMAPTDILARQHFENFSRLLFGTGVRVALLSGKLAQKKRAETLSALASGEADIAIGTHALIQEKVEFARLGLVVTDEQHRFGIAERATLAKKSDVTPDVLVMTATPIPRTMTLTVYGDLDVSRIERLPPGRRPVRTFVRTGERRPLVYAFVRREIESGRQAYVVAPLIEDGSDAGLPSAERIYEELSGGIFRGVSCALIHGRLKPKEKEEIMQRFYGGSVKLLVATTVIEVGVDVPNASVMVIENAERFGLAELHQLRGRIGRGGHSSYCILLAGTKSAANSERLSIVERTTDGFLLAEEDLRLRGPGQFFGTMQHGSGDMKIANALRDTDILIKARRAAAETLAKKGGAEAVRRVLDAEQRKNFSGITDA